MQPQTAQTQDSVPVVEMECQASFFHLARLPALAWYSGPTRAEKSERGSTWAAQGQLPTGHVLVYCFGEEMYRKVREFVVRDNPC